MTTNDSNRPLTVNATAELPYSVNLWGSHPEAGNDDCWTGENFATNEEACAAFMATVHGAAEAIDRAGYAGNWMYAEVDGPDVYLVAKNPRYSERRARREEAAMTAEWRSERAMQAGMMGGVEAYNDELMDGSL